MNRREFLHHGAATIAASTLASRALVRAQPTLPLPTPPQLQWHRDELALFLHFGVNTFTDREWGDGTEDPRIFDPERLDARQWARTAKSAGARALVLTAKHHDGFCLWPTRTTKHSVASSPWRSGNGDVVREFVDACRAEGLRPGLYLSPWDRNNPTYGDSPRYNDLYADQLTELLTRYGTITEVWFDGANGEGPNGKRQTYDWPRTFGLVRRLQPDAVIFSDAGPDVRWCGNERGIAGDPNWGMVDPAAVPYPGADGPAIIGALQHGDPAGTVWRPAECDVSIRKGWFHHASEDATVRSASDLVELYCSSVGRNGKLLLNVPPTRAGLLHDADVAALTAFRAARDAMFGTPLTHDDGRTPWRETWRATGARSAVAEWDFGAPATIGIARLAEDISRGQRVARYTLAATTDGDWRTLSTGSTIGHAKIDRFPVTSVRRIRLTIADAIASPEPVRLSVYRA